MKEKFDQLSLQCSKKTTLAYSTSFSLGIRFLSGKFHDPIYAIYGFVRLADEIVDSFHGYDKEALLNKFEADMWQAIEQGISLNPILHSFQQVVHAYQIDRWLIECFLSSMRTDLDTTTHSAESLRQYILGSAEVVGLMCLKVFTEGDARRYEELKPAAMRLGSAFQKVNFLRDLKADLSELNRNYFPVVEPGQITAGAKRQIEEDIEADFAAALEGIRRLPPTSRGGVYLAYSYYRQLFQKIRRAGAGQVLSKRIRIHNGYKLVFMLQSYMRHQLNLL